MNHKLQQALRRFIVLSAVGESLIHLVMVAGAAALALAVYVMLDYFLALPRWALVVIDAAALLFLAVNVFASLGRIWLAPRRKAAAQALDAAAGNHRQELLAALEFERELRHAPDGLGAFLRKEAVARAVASLDKVKMSAAFPAAALNRALRRGAVLLALAGAAMAVNPAATRVILSRIFAPSQDIPPYSPLVFTVSPDAPKVVYGDTLELSTRISGGEIDAPVWLLTRDDAGTFRGACFRESDGSFSRRIEKVTTALQFRFQTGKARTTWRQVELLTRPKITLAKLTVQPPAYSRLGPSVFFAGTEDLLALKGSKVQMTISSNRPLAGGKLAISAKNGGGTELLDARLAGPDAVVFEWTVRGPATLRATIRDVRGANCDEPLTLVQRIRPDAPPEVAMPSPGLFTMATPEAKVPFAVTASDDLGLRSVELVSALTGYHDRPRPLGPSQFTKDFDHSFVLDLGKLGVRPGETLEFYAEAADFNPDLGGITATEPARVKIISPQDYAKMLRARLRVEDVLRRYEEVAQARQQLLDTLDSALREPSPEALQQVKDANERLRGKLEAIAKDFPVYKMEEQQRQRINDMFLKTVANDANLAKMKPGDPDLSKRLRTMRDYMSKDQRGVEQMARSAAALRQAAGVMRLTATFADLIRRQGNLARRLKKLAESRGLDSAPLQRLGEEERAIHDEFVKTRQELERQAAALPESLVDLKESAMDFAKKADELGIAGLLDSAARAAGDGDTAKAWNDAALAHERMLQLKSKCKLSGMMGDKLCFKLSDNEDMTAAEMLEAILSQQGGGGAGEGDEDGYSAGANTPLNVPLFGPGHSGSGEGDEAKTGAKDGKGKSRGAHGAIGGDAKETLKPDAPATTPTDKLDLDEVPEKYRDAVKRYFNE